MTAEQLQREQDLGAPKEDLTPYAGQWVALREGYVVASDLSAVALRAQEGVSSTDTLMPIPASPGGTFIL